MSDIGNYLMKIRQEQQISIRQLAKLTGVSHSEINKIENGDIMTGVPRVSDNDGLWTQVYLGSLAFCYAVTKDEKVLEAARRTLYAMGYLTNTSSSLILYSYFPEFITINLISKLTPPLSFLIGVL